MSTALELDPRPVDWTSSAACRGRPTAIWFPTGHGFAEDVALAMCRGCPVRADCLADALEHETSADYRFGIRGGLSPAERERLEVGRRVDVA